MVPDRVLPELRESGMTEEQERTMMVDNAVRWLRLTSEPQRRAEKKDSRRAADSSASRPPSTCGAVVDHRLGVEIDDGADGAALRIGRPIDEPRHPGERDRPAHIAQGSRVT